MRHRSVCYIVSLAYETRALHHLFTQQTHTRKIAFQKNLKTEIVAHGKTDAKKIFCVPFGYTIDGQLKMTKKTRKSVGSTTLCCCCFAALRSIFHPATVGVCVGGMWCAHEPFFLLASSSCAVCCAVHAIITRTRMPFHRKNVHTNDVIFGQSQSRLVVRTRIASHIS